MKLNSFEVDIPNKEVAEWFNYKSSGNTLSFTIPPNSGNNFSGFGLWIVYKCKYTDRGSPYVKAVIINKTKNVKTNHDINLRTLVAGKVQSRVECISDEKIKRHGINILFQSRDRINISFQSILDPCIEAYDGLKVEKCGAHILRAHC